MTLLPIKSTKNAGGVEPISLEEMVAKIDEISSGDSNSSLREFLENRTTLKNCYSNYKGVKLVKFTINPLVRDLSYCWVNCSNITIWDEVCDTSLITNLSVIFQSCAKLKIINGLKTEKAKNMDYAFNACLALETISTPLDFSNVTSTTMCFNLCKALKNIYFVAKTINCSLSFANCDKLTAESVQSIIDGLATVTTAQTITFHKNIALSDEQKQTINDKGWTLVQA